MKTLNTIILIFLPALCWFVSMSKSQAKPTYTLKSVVWNEPKKTFDAETDLGTFATNLNPKVQSHLESFMRRHQRPTASILIAEVSTSRIIAMAQAAPIATALESESPTAMFNHFPSASTIKAVIAAGSVEFGSLSITDPIPVRFGCARVPRGQNWLRKDASNSGRTRNLGQAFASSCNGFFGRLAVEYLGWGFTNHLLNLFGWNQAIPSDLVVPPSHILSGHTLSASTQTLGELGSGLAGASLSPMHATWINLILATGLTPAPLTLIADGPKNARLVDKERILSTTTVKTMHQIMKTVVSSRGTAGNAFAKRRYRSFRKQVGGKTGRLSQTDPKGITTWFMGLYPIQAPRYAIAAVVVHEDNLWQFDGHSLAAEGIWSIRKFIEK